MTGRISPREFLESPGVEDWRLLSGGAWAGGHFRTGSFALGAALVAAIGEVAAAADRHPDVDLWPEGVTFGCRARTAASPVAT
jgi:4a-hydroxytetrahydrobiopterin dehydratase